MKYFKNLLLLTLCSIIISLDLIAQNKDLETLAFLQSKDGIFSRSPVDEKKYQKAKSIYFALIKQKGDYRTKIPKFKMTKNETVVAEITYLDIPEITLEEKAYDVCASIGDEAIAFLLAHELTHYYEKHAWKNEFTKSYSDLAIGTQLRSTENQIINETQADYLGGFLAYTAGYGLNYKAEILLKNLYSSYMINNGSIPNYPSLEDRITLNKRSEAKLELFTQLYETANHLLITGNYKEAVEYYQYILMRYQSNKLYNNLGLCLVLQAKQYFNLKELKYEYPLELENKPIFERDASTIKLRDSLLNAAIISFDIALGMDPAYLPAKLNKAISFCLLGEYQRARYYCEQEIEKSKDSLNYSKTLIDNKVLLGIVYDFLRDKKNAKLYFEKSIKQKSEIGKLNFKIFNNTATLSAPVNSNMEEEWADINGVTLKSFTNEPNFDDEKIVNINSNFTFYQTKTDSLDYKIFFNHNTSSNMVQYYLLVKPGSSIKTSINKIGEGSTKENIIKAYGNPINTIETTEGTIYLYKRLFFNIGKSDKVESWGNYMSKVFG